MDFISLINGKNDYSIQCNTCLDKIEDETSYIVDCKDDSTYCNTECLRHSFEFNLAFSY
jgi:hypothetical protein